nr:5'-nucleotidase [Methylomarinum sp. Ch1-1]MDP4521117.1 5'-nucleotidase [Methylomarinum sp. Ch1-1]
MEKLVVAISSRALFDLDESHNIFQQQGKEAFCRYQIEHENEILKPGFGFNLVKKFLNLNLLFPGEPLVEIILLSQNSADTGLRIFNSIEHYELDISRAAFTSGDSPYRYMPAFGAHLFLSANGEDVEKALASGYAAATIVCGSENVRSEQLRIAFDGDAVLFPMNRSEFINNRGWMHLPRKNVKTPENPWSAGRSRAF